MTFFASLLLNALLMSLLAALYLLLRVPLQRHVRPATCYAMGIIVAIGLLIPLRPAFPVPLLDTLAPIQQLAAPDVELPDTIPYDYDFTTAEHQERLAQAQYTNKPVALDVTASKPATETIWRIAALLWALGMVFSLLYHAARQLRFRRLVRRWREGPSSKQRQALTAACEALGIQRPPRLWQCGAVQSPMLAFLFRPTILLPHQPFLADELALILRHELTHYRRHDLGCKAIVLAAVCLHWWNPLVRRLARGVSADCEMACDDAVLKGADLTQRKVYGETILSAITRARTPYAALSTYFYEGRNDMKRRFRSMLNLRPRRTGGLIVILCLCLTLFTGSVFATERAAPAAEPAQAVSPTTGMRYPPGRDDAYRPVLIEISNSEEARPQLSMSLADVVYEYIVWGPGHTRYLALYNDYHPEMVGAVRSAQTIAMSLRDAWDCPIVFMGGNISDAETSVYRFIDTHSIPSALLFDGAYSADHPGDIFSRLTSRVSPHNVVANLQLLAQAQWPANADGTPHAPALPTLRFANVPSQGDAAATEIIIPYDDQPYSQAYLPRYTYDAEAEYYERWYDGAPQLDGLTGQRIVASNVIVLYAELIYENDFMAQPLWTMTGEGKLDVFIGGRHIAGAWRRPDDASEFTYLDADGNPLLLTPGKTFIQVVPQEMEIHYS